MLEGGPAVASALTSGVLGAAVLTSGPGCSKPD